MTITTGPDVRDVEALTDLLDLMRDFPSNEQRARYLLSCNWMRDRDTRLAGFCGAIPPNVMGPVPCNLAAGHEGRHFSTTGCVGSEIRWDDTIEATR